MDKFKSIFKREQQATSSQGGPAIQNGQVDTDSKDNPEGLLCPVCMKAYPSVDQLQRHFDASHGDAASAQVPADKELELLKMQLTASEESRSLLSSELMNMQKQLQELAANQPDQPPDLKPEVQRLETQLQLLQIENTELAEKCQLSDKCTREAQENLTTSRHEQKTLHNSLETERDKYSLLSQQLAEEKQRSGTVQEECRRLSEQLRKAEVSVEQQKQTAGRFDEVVAKLAGKEELCRNLEQQINDGKQNSIKHESEITQLKKALETKDESLMRSSVLHEEMKTAMDSKIHSMEELMQEKTTSFDRALSDNEQLQHKILTIETRLSESQTELLEANKKYDDLHQNFVQRIDAGEGTNLIVTQLKEDNARVQEKLKHTEEKLQLEKEESYQKLRKAEARQKELEQKFSAITIKVEETKAELSAIQREKDSLVSSHEQHLSSLRSEQEALVISLEAKVSHQTNAVQTLEVELVDLRKEKEEVSASLQERHSEVSALSQKLVDREGKVTQLEDSCNNLTQQLAQQSEELSSFVTQNDSLTNELAARDTETASLKQQLELTSHDKLEQSRNFEQQITSFNERIASLEVDLKASEELLQEKLSALDQLQEDSAVLNEKVLELKELLSSNESEKRRLDEENISMQALVTSLEMAKLELSRETERMQTQSDNNFTQLGLVSAELERSKQQVLEKEASILVLKQQVDTQTKEGESLQNSLLEQIDQMGTAAKEAEIARKTEVSKFQTEIKDLHNKIKKQSETNAALSREHSAALDKLNTTEGQLKSMEAACESAKAEVVSLQQQMDKRSDDHSHILQETTEILQRTSDENEALTRALTELKTENSVIEEQLLNAQKNSDDWQSKHRLLQDDLEAVRQAMQQEMTTSEETKQLLISYKLDMQNKYEAIEEEKLKIEKELREMVVARDEAEEKAQDNLRILEAALAAEKSKMEEAEAGFNMQLVSLTENLSLNKTDLTATQEKLMDVVKHNDELRGFNIELETKLEASNDERNMLWNRCMTSEDETKALRDEKESLRSQIENLNSALHELGRENQSLQIKTTKAQARRWVEDEDVLDCTNCAKSFNVRVRKHHCRNCGNIFCHDCSSKQLQLPISSKPSRVCDNCYVELSR
ncbi:early endosome antigen 1-like [Watersipora subatra]|uniref:early endosome antigen 1-like n=1 Tax=Watersipora subatra TaxID=2589382 RepID=UPI00355B3CDE